MTQRRSRIDGAPSIVPEGFATIPGWHGRRGREYAEPGAPRLAGALAIGAFRRIDAGETLSPAERYVAAMRTAVLNGDLALAESYRNAAKAGLGSGAQSGPERMSAIFESVDRLIEFPEIGGFSGISNSRPSGLDRADLIALARIVATVSYQAAFPGEAGDRL
jgi:uncharacterized protein YciW